MMGSAMIHHILGNAFVQGVWSDGNVPTARE